MYKTVALGAICLAGSLGEVEGAKLQLSNQAMLELEMREALNAFEKVENRIKMLEEEKGERFDWKWIPQNVRTWGNNLWKKAQGLFH